MVSRMELINDIEQWWPRLPQGVQAWLEENPDSPVSTEAICAIVDARGYGPVGAAWAGEDGPFRFYLTEDDQDWIRARVD